MKTIKTYEDFVNEEINLKKALATGALAAGMAFSNPSIAQNIQKPDTILTTRVNKPVVIKKTDLGECDLEKSNIVGYYLDNSNIWKSEKGGEFIMSQLPKYTNIKNTNSKIITKKLDEYNKVLFMTFGHFVIFRKPTQLEKETPELDKPYVRGNGVNAYVVDEEMYFTMDKKDFDTLSKLNLNKTYIFNLNKFSNDLELDMNEVELDKKIKNQITTKSLNIYKLYIKVGYSDNKKIVRFAISSGAFNFEKTYYELSYDDFSKIWKKDESEISLSKEVETSITKPSSDSSDTKQDINVYTWVEDQPEPLDGFLKLQNYINSNIKNSNKDVYGIVFLKFIVEIDGSISNIEVEKGIVDFPEIDKEAIRVMNSYPGKWKPGKDKGRYVRSYYRFPIRIKN